MAAFQASVHWDEGFEATLAKPNMMVIDNRNADELEVKPATEGAVHMPCRRDDDPTAVCEAAIAAGTLPADKNTPIVVYCAIGFRSGRCAEAMRGLGYTDVKNGGGVDELKRGRGK
eukprot:NODE_23650_length_657_cov_2.818868.p1 GENE.NODE_23650_length_657_cov_2.818868~~NODE_23650_length_657_cov_2.818868.p1  ORF type:complete len:116 (-),score=40.91 NODE_23650_length_657_cov_2.818868:253-600(-)